MFKWAFYGTRNPPPVKHVEPKGFEGFLSTMTVRTHQQMGSLDQYLMSMAYYTMQAAKDTNPAQMQDNSQRKMKPVQPKYNQQNVFAVLNNGDDDDMRMLQTPAPVVHAAAGLTLQPATFTFQSSLQSSLRFQMAAPASDIDPDL